MQGKVGRGRQAVGAAPVPDDLVWKRQLFHQPNDTLRLRHTKVMNDQQDFLLACRITYRLRRNTASGSEGTLEPKAYEICRLLNSLNRSYTPTPGRWTRPMVSPPEVYRQSCR